MSFREKLDRLLVAMYYLRERRGTRWVLLQDLATALGWQSPLDVIEAARFLQTQGYVRSDFRLGGAVAASLAPAGDMYLNDKGAELQKQEAEVVDILDRYVAEHEGARFSIEGTAQPSLEIERALAFDRIRSLTKRLEPLEPKALIKEYLVDLQILELELSKLEPDRNVLDSKLQSLSRLSLPLGEEVKELVELLNT